MIKYKQFIKTLTLGACSLFFVGCSDFLDVNENPNDPAKSVPKLTLPVAQEQLASINGTQMTYLGQYIMYNWSFVSNFSANQDFARYSITSSFYGSIFNNSYIGTLKNLAYIDNYKDPQGLVDYSRYRAISTIMKAFQYQYLVDLYGDVPYSEANKRAENQTPKYDKAEDIYKDLIGKLTEVVATLDNLPTNDENPKDQDIIFKGNVKKWQQFANTIKLRFLLRLSNTGQDAYIKEEIAKIIANGKGFIDSNVVANPGYSDNSGKLNPFYGYFKEYSTKKSTDRDKYTVASDYIISYLKNTNDPRLKRLYAEAKKGGYQGSEQSTVLTGEGFTTDDLSGVGPGLIKDPSQDQPIMLLTEALFLQAEAVQRGYMVGDAKALYHKAIEESFEFLGVENYQTAASTYYSQDIPNVSFDTSSNKIQAIITQKSIALNGTSSIEIWLEYNRTGFPTGLPIPAEANRSHRPYRLLYPSSEIARNSNNVPKQTTEDAFTKKIFWQR
ncbi:SusD/RagB family nutrient-binding outer membrane lipoprotein [Capnocytophaga canimorsus]|uniref:SusD/RagB family nutrient-binding outer membrane lipoprotein n=1 Tax=Capnocytophaga canimorsus TaxID=28188 RepID=UPI0037CED97E